MSLSSPSDLITGLITGVPTSAGTFTFSVQVSDSTNAMASSTLSLTIVQVPVISATGIMNAASYAAGGVAPGEMITIFGSGLGPPTLSPMQTDARGYVSTSLGGTQVLFDGTPAPLIYSLAGQVSAIVPYETFGKSSTQVQVIFQSQSSSTVSVPVVTAMPGVFTLDSSGSGPGAIVNQNGTVNSATNPASAGSIVMIFATGEGETNPDGTDGKPDGFPAPTPIAQPVSCDHRRPELPTFSTREECRSRCGLPPGKRASPFGRSCGRRASSDSEHWRQEQPGERDAGSGAAEPAITSRESSSCTSDGTYTVSNSAGGVRYSPGRDKSPPAAVSRWRDRPEYGR